MTGKGELVQAPLLDGSASADIGDRIRSVEAMLETYLNALEGRVPVGSPSREDPGSSAMPRLSTTETAIRRDARDYVRTKNLTKAAAHLQSMLPCVAGSHVDSGCRGALDTVLQDLEHPWDLSHDMAWELADRTEILLVRVSNNARLAATLRKMKDDDPRQGATRYLSANRIDFLLQDYQDEKLPRRREAVESLVSALEAFSQECRKDRAKTRLQASYLRKMATFLVFSIVWIVASFMYATSVSPSSVAYSLGLLVLVAFAGATGSVVSKALKLAKRSSNSETIGTNPPLGIRALLSADTVLYGQAVVGSAVAIFAFFMVSAGLVQFGVNPLNPAGFALLGFLAGYSEAYFVGILDRIAGQRAGSYE